MRTLVERWDGLRWAVLPSPGPQDSVLYSVAVVSAADVWAVGTAGTGPGDRGSLPLVEHWNGRSWRLVRLPGLVPAGSSAALLAVTAWARGPVVAVGSVAIGRGPSRPLVVRWTGSRWQGIPVARGPGVSASNSPASLVGVVALAPSSVLAIGAAGAGSREHALVLEGSLRRLQPVSSAVLGARMTSLTAAAATEGGGLFLAGTTPAGGGSASLVMARRVRASWALDPAPGPGRAYREIAAIAGSSPRDAWAVGAFANGPGGPSARPLVEHWDGRAWRAVVVPDPDPGPGADGGLDAVAVAGPADVWAVGGSTVRRCGPTLPLAEHWDGHLWSVVAAP